jgi:hypothetical protein
MIVTDFSWMPEKSVTEQLRRVANHRKLRLITTIQWGLLVVKKGIYRLIGACVVPDQPGEHCQYRGDGRRVEAKGRL